jgi:hypothetical protein
MEEDEVGRPHVGETLAGEQGFDRSGRRAPVVGRDEEDPVGLAEAAARPGRRAGLRLVNDEAVRLLLLVQVRHDPGVPRGVPGGLGGALAERGVERGRIEVPDAPVPSERLDEPPGEFRDPTVLLRRGDRDRRDPAGRGAAPAAEDRLVVPDDPPRQAVHEARVRLEEPAERFPRQAEEVGVATRPGRRASPLAREQRHLAEALPRAGLADRAQRAVGERQRHLDPAARDDVEAVARLPVLEDGLAAGDPDRLELRADAGEVLRGEAPEEARRRQDLGNRQAHRHPPSAVFGVSANFWGGC